MSKYDVLVVGGGIAGSVAAKYLARDGLKTLLIERQKTPRNKPCSGIQFSYFEKMLDEKIPKAKMCTNPLTKIEMVYPDEKVTTAPFKMLNFMRDEFDDWLNKVAIEYGAEFRDQCLCKDFTKQDDQIIVSIENELGEPEQIEAKYVIDATSLQPFFRRKLRPEDYQAGSSGATLNYHIQA